LRLDRFGLPESAFQLPLSTHIDLTGATVTALVICPVW
jgi:hypothetical protein